MKCNAYFSKTEDHNGMPTEYRIYLNTVSGWPFMIRSALDAADNVHEEIVNQCNDSTDYLKSLLHKRELLGNLTVEQLGNILSITARKTIVYMMKNDGWTMYCNDGRLFHPYEPEQFDQLNDVYGTYINESGEREEA